MNSAVEHYIKTKGTNLNLRGNTQLTDLPDNFTINGYLDLSSCTRIYELPKNLTIKGSLNIDHSSIRKISKGLKIEGSFSAAHCQITSLPDDIKIRHGIDLQYSTINSLPNNLQVNGHLILLGCHKLKTLPQNLKVEQNLILVGTNLTSLKDLPWNLQVGAKILSSSFTDEQAKHYIKQQRNIKHLETEFPEIQGTF